MTIPLLGGARGGFQWIKTLNLKITLTDKDQLEISLLISIARNYP